MHDSIEADVRKSANEGTRKRCDPSKGLVFDLQQFEDKRADGATNNTCYQTDNECAKYGVRDAMKNCFSLNDADQWLDVHEHLGATKDHKTEMPAADSLKRCTWA